MPPRSGSQGPSSSDRISTDDRLSPFSEGKPFVHFMRRMKGVHVVRHSDGSIEKTETVDQDGMTCKTVTITDPNGKSTTTTSCEKSDGPINLMQRSPFMMGPPHPEMNQGLPNTDVPKIQAPSVDTGLNKDDASFFSKLFGGFWNKPKS